MPATPPCWRWVGPPRCAARNWWDWDWGKRATGTADVRNAKVLKFTAEIEGGVMKALVYDGTVKPDTSQQIECGDHVRGDMTACLRSNT